MLKLRKILAFVLIAAMTLSMLPVFAGAEETAAVETAAAPAVEDVAEIAPAAPAEATPIETVAAETVAPAAELQAQAAYASDAEAIEAGYFLKTISPTNAVLYFNTLKDAFSTANSWTTAGGKIELIADWDLVEPGVTSPLTSTYTDSSDPEVSVQGAWFDLCGHTLILSYGATVDANGKPNGSALIPFKCSTGNNKFNFKNGRIFARNRGAYGAYRYGLISMGSESKNAPSSGGKAYQQTVTLKDMEIYTLRYDATTGFSSPGKTNYINPIVFVGQWNATINIYDSTLLSEDGPGIMFKKNEYATSSNFVDVNYTVNVYGESYVGAPCKDTGRSVAPTAIRATLSSSTANGSSGAHNLTVNLSEDAVMIGSSFIYKSSAFNYQLNKIQADGTLKPTTVEETTYTCAVADRDSVPTEALGQITSENFPITYLPEDTYTAFRAHRHDKVHHDAVAPTLTETGNAEYWSCSGCDELWAADGVTETTLEEITIPVVCQHGNVEHHEAVSATYGTTGTIEYWYCPDCNSYFSDAEATQPIDAASIVVPKLIPDPNTCTEADLIAYGYLATATAPDGDVKAYESLNAAYKEGAKWTTAGGVVKLLRDYTVVNTSTSTASGLVNSGADSKSNNSSYSYANDEDPSINGFWLDLGGHTLTLKSGQPLFYTNASLPINIRNGSIIAQNNAQKNPTFGILKSGYTSSTPGTSTELYHPVYTLKNVNMVRLPYVEAGSNGPAVFFSVYQSTLNLIDSSIMSTDYSPVYYYKAAPSGASNALLNFAAQSEYKHEINLSGASTLGVTSTERKIVFLNNISSGIPVQSHSVTMNTTGADVTFVGGGFFYTNYAGDCVLTAPKGYFETTAQITIPDGSTVAAETTLDAKPDMLEPVEYPAYRSALIYEDTSLAAFTPEGGTAGEQVKLWEAVQQWIDAGRRGTVTLLSDVTVDSMRVTGAYVGGAFNYYTTSSSSQYTKDAAIFLDAAAADGRLTLDLNGHTVTSEVAVVATMPGLETFDLTITNGKMIGKSGMLLYLDGSDVVLDMENVEMETTDATYCIYELRKGSSCSFLRNCSFTCEKRPNIYFITHEDNKNDATLLYYAKDCTFSAEETNYRPLYHATASSVHRGYTWINDGSNTFITGYENAGVPYFGGKNADFDCRYFNIGGEIAAASALKAPYVFTTDASRSLLTTEENADATILAAGLTLPFRTLGDALACAEALGRCAFFTPTVRLNRNTAFAESAKIGGAGYVSSFTLDLNGKTLTDVNGVGLAAPASGNGSSVTMKVVGAFGDGATQFRFFENVPELAYAAGNEYVVQKGRFFRQFSLNLEENVKINLYTNEQPDEVYYIQDGEKKTIAAPDAAGAWVIDTLAAKDMFTGVDAYAIKASAGKYEIDLVKDVSVKSYVDSKPAAGESGDVKTTLEQTLKTMLVYGKLAEKYFAEDYTRLKPEEIDQLGLVALPTTSLSNLTDAPCAVTGMANLRTDDAETGFYGTAAVLSDSIHLKFYFTGAEFNGATATVNGQTAALETNGNFKFVKVSVPAKDFDAAITVTLTDANGDTIGTVTDSVSGYTARIASDSNAYRLVQALRAYGADAMRYSAAKLAAQGS